MALYSDSNDTYGGNHMMMDKVSSSGSISHKVGTCRVEDASMNSSVIHAKVVDNISSSANIGRLIVGKSIEVDIHNNPIVHTTTQIVVESSSGHIMTTNPNQMENGGKILDSSAMHDTIINVDNTDTAYERCISQNEGIENNVVLMSERKKIQRNTSSGYLSGNALCCKVSVIFGVCCIIGIYLIPIILYYVGQIRGNPETNPEFSHEKNTSIAKIKLTQACNYSTSNLDSDCMEEILYTYEALRTINLPSSQQYCSERVETLFCKALMECGNESYVKDIVCQQVRQKYCTAEWRILEVHNQTDGLIDCEEYEETTPLNCSDQFGLADDGTVCLLLCEEFSQYSEAYTTPHLVLGATAFFLSIIGGIVVIVISSKNRKTMFRFPQVLVVINAGILATVHLLQFISTVGVGRWNLLCSRKFVFDAFHNPTDFCTVQGSLIITGVVLYAYFWLLYVCHLALKVFYPLKSAKLFNSDHSRIIFIAEVLIIFLIGTVPSIILATVGSNYRVIGFPPIYCGIGLTYRIYVLVIPSMHYGIFKREHGKSVGKQVCTCQFTVPEVKIVFVLFYWLLCTILIYTNFSISDGRADIINSILQRYAGCMAGGHREHHDCHTLRLDLEAETYPVIDAISLVCIAFLNFVTLPFVIQFQAVKKFVRQTTKKLAN